MPDIDIFDFCRYLLSLVVTIYVMIYTARTIWGHLVWFRSSRRFSVMGHYAVVLLLRARLRRFGGELLQIGMMLVLLGAIVGLHWILV